MLNQPDHYYGAEVHEGTSKVTGQNDLSSYNAEEMNCNNDIECRIDGEWNSWSTWSNCSSSSRHRECDKPPPKHGGLQCSVM